MNIPLHVWNKGLTAPVVTFTFETGSEKYKELENGVYVAAGHFVKEEGQKGLIVEYKVSKVVY
jgi:RNA polymerase I-specific transcription initiation factor RRN6